MLDNEPTGGDRVEVVSSPGDAAESTTPVRRTRATRRKATPAPAAPEATQTPSAEPGAAIEAETAAEGVATSPARPRRRRTAAAASTGNAADPAVASEEATAGTETVPPAKASRARRKKAAPVEPAPPVEQSAAATPAVEPTEEPAAVEVEAEEAPTVGGTTVVGVLPLDDTFVAETPAPISPGRRAAALPPAVLFMPPETDPAVATEPTGRRGRRAAPVPTEEQPAAAPAGAVEEQPADGLRRRRRGRRDEEPVEVSEPAPDEPDESAGDVENGVEDGAEEDLDELDEEGRRRRRRRGRRGRGRGKGPTDDGDEENEAPAAAETDTEADGEDEDDDTDEPEGVTRRRRRRRRKGAGDSDTVAEDGVHTVVRIREPRRSGVDEVQGLSGSTRLEAKRQRRRDGREQRRTRPPILSESEFLARREAVDRVMVVRQKNDRTQVAVLEDGILVEHYVARATSGTMVGNVYLGKVQNVLPSMEAAFVDIGRGRNAVLYAGEVNWDETGLEGRARSIEQALRSGDPVLVQVTKDPIGHKGARLTSHIALSGRHLVYVPHGNASGISRKLPDNERKRLRDILKKLVPDGAGVIVRTAAEGASEDELSRDVKRLQSQWEDIQAKAAEGGAPVALSEEPDLVIRVVRDLFNEDFRELVVQGDQAYGEVEAYLNSVSPDLVQRLRRHAGVADVFAEKRIDEQLLKGLDRKVFLPSGGHLVIDRTEAMTVVDVNTGKYTGVGGNLEETVTRNNLEAAEEIVRQLRLRDLGGIVVIDFIDMVLESNRELVLRRLTECLGRDRTKHQVTEITSLGLVQMTRKRIGAGLLEVFSETCEPCKGRGLIIHTEPVPEKRSSGAGTQVKAVASASNRTESAQASNRTESASAGGRQRRRRGAAEPVERPEQAAESPVAESPVAGVDQPGEAMAAVADLPPPTDATVAGSGIARPAARLTEEDDDDYDISGYDLSRYETDDSADAEPLQLTGADDPDAAADDSDDDGSLGAGAGGRRRSRRPGARRRTRP